MDEFEREQYLRTTEEQHAVFVEHGDKEAQEEFAMDSIENAKYFTREVADDSESTLELPRAVLTQDAALGRVMVRVVPVESDAGGMLSFVSSRPRWVGRRKTSGTLASTLLLLVLVCAGSISAYSGFTLLRRHTPKYASVTSNAGSANGVGNTLVLNGANTWDGDTQVTAPLSNNSQESTQGINVSSLFQGYYTSHNGAINLGTPLTVAFPTAQGELQFFQWGALLVPSFHRTQLRGSVDPLLTLATNGVRDDDTGIVRLPLLQTLLTVGSEAHVGGTGSTLTYVALRQQTNPSLMLTTTAANRTIASTPLDKQGVFVKGGTRAGQNTGHIVPLAIWNYIHRSDVSPDGWDVDFDAPLTEAIPFTSTINGSVHHMLAQVFWRDGVMLDLDASPTQAQRLNTGLAYLSTVDLPPVLATAGQPVWVQSGSTTSLTALSNAPAGQAVAHVGQNFPLSLLGDTAWNTGTLWYHVQWTAPKHTATGWIAASALGFTSPGTSPVQASLDVLSPDLASYLAGIGSNAGVMVYDVTRQRYYSYNADSQFMMASSMKVPIMLSFLNMTEQQGREPDDSENALLTTMIENSNNDSASSLYFDSLGGAPAVDSYMQSLGISSSQFSADNGSWGYSLITPRTMVDLLTRLNQGKVLNAQDRSLALSLMSQVESDQQVGVGDTAPNGASVAMKDGWVPAPDNSWLMNSSGIVTVGSETYILAVYTQEQSSLDDGQAITHKVCSTIASLLP
jgi:beta-lactamase class A